MTESIRTESRQKLFDFFLSEINLNLSEECLIRSEMNYIDYFDSRNDRMIF